MDAHFFSLTLSHFLSSRAIWYTTLLKSIKSPSLMEAVVFRSLIMSARMRVCLCVCTSLHNVYGLSPRVSQNSPSFGFPVV